MSTPRVEIQIYNYGHFFPEKLHEIKKKGPRRGASLAPLRFATINDLERYSTLALKVIILALISGGSRISPRRGR